MPVIGITGGIASGKSTVTRLLAENLRNGQAEKVQSFSADEYGHELLENDPVVRSQIHEQFGNDVIGVDRALDRARLRQLVFANADRRKALEAILHPKIHQSWRDTAEHFHLKGHYFVAEIPLLYETDSSPYFDCIVVVEADVQVQLERLSSKRGWSLETARRVIEAQMPAEEKTRRANILILNHYTEKLLHCQIELAAQALLTRYA
ncbi:MAG: dephospho-CoA kinase [Chthoniobacterales bacterium]